MSAALILLAGTLVYSNSLAGPFIYDDQFAIVENPSIHHFTTALSPPRDTTVAGRPVLNLSFALNHALGGLPTGGYHAVNLLIHLLAALTLFGIVRRALLLPRWRERHGPRADGPALAVALLWMVHPLQTESVTYIVQRAESLMGLLFLLTLYTFIRSLDSPRPALWRSLSVAACALATATKEVAVVAPLVVLLFDSIFVEDSLRGALRRRRFYWSALFATWIIPVALGAGSARSHSAGFGGGLIGPAQYLIRQFGVIAHYMRLCLWPHPLVFDYFWPVTVESEPVLPFIIVGSLAAATLLLLARRHPAGFMGAWFFLILAPTSSVVPIWTELAAEHRLYLPLAGVVVLVVFGVDGLLRRAGVSGRAAVVLVAFVASALGAATFARNRAYGDDVRLWEDTIRKAPQNTRAHLELGAVLDRRGDTAGAMAQARRALEINPEAALAHMNLGFLLDRAGRTDEAIAHYRETLRLQPHYETDSAHVDRLHNNLGFALAGLGGHDDEAALHYREAIRINPNNADPHYNLGVLLSQRGEAEAAIAEFRRAIELKSELAPAHADLGLALSGKGLHDEAIKELREAIRLDPKTAEYFNNLGVACVRAGRPNDARAAFTQALALDPALTNARENLSSLPPQ